MAQNIMFKRLIKADLIGDFSTNQAPQKPFLHTCAHFPLLPYFDLLSLARLTVENTEKFHPLLFTFDAFH